MAALSEIYAYYSHSKVAWRTLQIAVRRFGLKLTPRIVPPAAEAGSVSLATLAQRYVNDELPSATLQRGVSIVEGFLFDLIRAWLRTYTQSLGARQLRGVESLALADKAAMVDALVEKELRDVFYDRPANWFEYLKSRVNITAPSAADAAQF